MTTTPNAAAQDAYITAQCEARALVAQVTAALDTHQDNTHPDAIHWGHVGDLTSMVAHLKELVTRE